jgi:hypothetical protein
MARSGEQLSVRVNITKASGKKEPFSENKLRQSLERAKVPSILIEQIVEHIEGELEEGMKTSDIYSHAYSLLNKKEHFIASRYSIKKALMDLGPSGYPFEKIIAELLKIDGFAVETGKTIQGHCISHEVDVIATRNNNQIFVECKFHHRAGYKTDVKAALYANARFWDIKKHLLRKTRLVEDSLELWLVTNTKLSSEAIRYSVCSGNRAIGWGYPSGGKNLQYLFDESGILPITCLKSLNRAQKNELLKRGFVICQQLVEHDEIFRSIGLNNDKILKVTNEIQKLCKKEIKPIKL